MNNIQKHVSEYMKDVLEDSKEDLALRGAWSYLESTIMDALSSSKEEHLQAKIDALMLEFCPEEMGVEQLEEYEAHQVIADPEEFEIAKQALKEVMFEWQIHKCR